MAEQHNIHVGKHLIDGLVNSEQKSYTPAEIEAMRSKYPFLHIPEQYMVEDSHPSDSNGHKSPDWTYREIMAVNSPVLGNDEQTSQPFYPRPVQGEKSTIETIDVFLKQYGVSADEERETELLERLIFNPVPPDFTSELNKLEPIDKSGKDGEHEGASSEQDFLINKFIASHPAGNLKEDFHEYDAEAGESAENVPSKPICTSSPAPSDNVLLSESLAKIYIRKGKYDKAFEIIKSLSLKYPEKSVYFANQLRFIQKVIDIQTYRANRNK